MISPRMFTALSAFYSSACTIQQVTETRDAAGQPVKTWANFASHVSLDCRLSPIGGSERKTNNQVYSVATHVIELAGNYPTITTKMRAVISAVNYDILLVEHDGEAASTRLVCEVVK
jgi:head-tail adaptor